MYREFGFGHIRFKHPPRGSVQKRTVQGPNMGVMELLEVWSLRRVQHSPYFSSLAQVASTLRVDTTFFVFLSPASGPVPLGS